MWLSRAQWWYLMTVDTDKIQKAKDVVRACHRDVDGCADDQLEATLARHVSAHYRWRGMRPFYEQAGSEAVVAAFWRPLRQAFTALTRREDVFIAGHNDASHDGAEIWTASMGHFVGLFDAPWLGIPATGRMAALRYAQFDCVADGAIESSALFCDVIGVMQQAGCYPLPEQTGAAHMYPGPRTHDGIHLAATDPQHGHDTLALINRMIDDLSALNDSGEDHCSPEYLARCWHRDMAWYGPAGIGSTMTIERYQQQHQYPFREQLSDKRFLGHVARIAEGNYGAFFGWPNLTNRSTGGFLGLPASATACEMRVVDVFRRDGDRLAENWVFIDLPHYLAQQGLDVLDRLQRLRQGGG
jgi:hypothetical protein